MPYLEKHAKAFQLTTQNPYLRKLNPNMFTTQKRKIKDLLTCIYTQKPQKIQSMEGGGSGSKKKPKKQLTNNDL